MPALGRGSRRWLAAAAFTSFAASFVTTPFVAHSAADRDALRVAAAPPREVTSHIVLVVPRRDPFADAAIAAAPAAAPPPIVRAAPANAIPALLRPLPPNPGAPPLPFGAPAQGARVTAVITGTHPFAILEESGVTRIVTVGDRIAGDPIVAIGGEGVRLEHGRLLAVAPAGSPPPLPEDFVR